MCCVVDSPCGVLGLDPRTQSFFLLGPWIKSKGAGYMTGN
jgi:hypothetical protein